MQLSSRTAILRAVVLLTAVAAAVVLPRGATAPVAAQGDAMTVAEVMKMPKIDAHAHIGAHVARASPRVHRVPREVQPPVAEHRRQRHGLGAAEPPDRSRAVAARRVSRSDRVGDVVHRVELGRRPTGRAAANATIDDGFAGGAVAVKIWKDVGMVLKDPDGKYVMADDPRLDPVFSALASTEPDARGPSRRTAQLLAAGRPDDRRWRSALLRRAPRVPRPAPSGDPELRSPDRRARSDARAPPDTCVSSAATSAASSTTSTNWRSGSTSTPTLAVDLSARIVHLQIQPREKVRAFLVKYQDRILYGTDVDFGARFRRGSADPIKAPGAAGRDLRVGRGLARDGPGTGARERARRVQVARCRASVGGPAEDLLRERAEVVSGDSRPGSASTDMAVTRCHT